MIVNILAVIIMTSATISFDSLLWHAWLYIIETVQVTQSLGMHQNILTYD